MQFGGGTGLAAAEGALATGFGFSLATGAAGGTDGFPLFPRAVEIAAPEGTAPAAKVGSLTTAGVGPSRRREGGAGTSSYAADDAPGAAAVPTATPTIPEALPEGAGLVGPRESDTAAMTTRLVRPITSDASSTLRPPGAGEDVSADELDNDVSTGSSVEARSGHMASVRDVPGLSSGTLSFGEDAGAGKVGDAAPSRAGSALSIEVSDTREASVP